MQGVQTDFERLGIGIASLASKECEGYDLGNAAERVILELGGTTPKMRAELLEKAEADARKFLTSQHKSLCDVAAEMTDSGDFLVRL